MNGLANGVFTGDTLLGLNNAPWVDWTEQATITGWSAFTVKSIKYKVVGNFGILAIGLQGTSNSATTSFTLPFNISATGALGYHIDNGSFFMGGFARFGVIASNVVDFYKVTASGNVNITNTWTASGTKGIFGNIVFQI